MNSEKSLSQTINSRDFIRVVLIALAYFAAHLLAFLFPDAEHILASVWPAGGIGLAALLLNRRRLWLPIIVAMFIAGNTANLVAGRPLFNSLGFMTANVIESFASAQILTYLCGEKITFRRVKEILVLFLVATVVNAGTAMIGAGVAWLAGLGSFWEFWKTWWVADSLGILIVAPLIVAWVHPLEFSINQKRRRILESAIILALWSVISFAVFHNSAHPSLFTPQPYMLVILISFASLRFSARGTTTAALIQSMILLSSNSVNLGPMVWGGDTLQDRLLLAQLFIISTTITSYLINATISERKQREEELRAAEAKYRDIFENAAEGIFQSTPQGRFLSVNPTMARIFGYDSPQEMVEYVTDASQQIHTSIQGRTEFTSQVELNGFVEKFEADNLRKNGSIFRTLTNARVVKDENGNVLYYEGFLIDITDRKQAEESLRSSENRLREVLENSLDASYKRDLKTNTYDYLSPVFTLITGYTPEEMEFLPIETIFNLIHADDLEEVNRIIDLSIAGMNGESYQVEYRFKHKNGTYRWLLDRFTCLRDVDGLPLARIGSVSDITERKHVQETLRVSEMQYRLLAENISDVIWIMDLESMRFRYLSPSVERLRGYTVEEVLAAEVSQAVSPNSMEKIEQAIPPRLQAAMQGSGQYYINEVEQPCKDGTTVWTEVTTRYILNSETGHWEVYGVSRNIQKRKKAEDALRAAKAELEQRVIDRTAELQAANLDLEKAARMKDEFLATMSHELRTPLTGILGMSQVLQMNVYGAMNEKQTVAIGTIEKSGKHLLELINEILDLTKLQAGKIDLETRACLLADICNASLEMVRNQAEQKKQELNYSISPVNILIRLDEKRICQAILNLLSNALKFTPEGGAIGLLVTGDELSHQVKISVTDTGIGIKEEDLPLLFKPFLQLDARLSRKYNGTGLGLTLVKKLVELHGGSVEVRSTIGKGSCFTVTLPWVE